MMDRLTCDVRVGNGTFKKGCKVSALQASIDARVDYTNSLEKRIQELEEQLAQKLDVEATQHLGVELVEHWRTRAKELEAAIREHKYQCDAHTHPADYDKDLYAVLDNKEEG